MLEILQLPVLSDNYIYLIHEPLDDKTAVVDPAEAEPVLAALEKQAWRLDYVLNTHHHWDHVGGNMQLKNRTGCRVVGARLDRSRIPGIDIELDEGDTFCLGQSTARVLAVSGHTRGHIAYWFRDDEALFCGDTLFVMGCGRLFEGTPAQMWQSLSKLKTLPGSTRVYCAHEYTQTNGRFALTVDPDNPALVKRMRQVDLIRSQNQPTVPSTIADELSTNPFFRVETQSIQKTLKMIGDDPVNVFTEIRRRKDKF